MSPHIIQRSAGLVIVVSGPSGSGKGCVIQPAIEADSRLQYSVSATTRAPREGEVDGSHYHFVSREAFEAMVERGDMLEHAEYAGNLYGTPAPRVIDAMRQGRDVILEIETDGAQQVRDKIPEAVFVMIIAPSAKVLTERLRLRATETEAEIAKRRAEMRDELASIELYDYVIVNDRLEEAIEDFRAILRSERARVRGDDVRAFIDENYGEGSL